MSVRVTQEVIEVIETRNPNARTTQFVVEAIETRNPQARVTQTVIEILQLSRTPVIANESVTSSIAVSDSIAHRLAFVDLSVTTDIAVASTAVGLRQIPNKYTGILGIKASQFGLMTLGTGLVQLTNTVDLAVTSEIIVDQTIDERNTNPRLTVSSPITVSQTISTNRDRVISVASPITVAQTVFARNTIIRQTVINSITVAPITRVSGTINISVQHNISANQTIAVRNSVVRLSVTSSLNASQGEVARNTNNRQYIVSMGHIDSTPQERNTQPRFSVTTPVHATQLIQFFNPNFFQIDIIQVRPTIAFRNTNPRLTVRSNVAVTQTIRKSPNEQSVQSDVTVYGDLPLVNIKFYVSPLQYHMICFMTVTEGFVGGSSNREVSVQTDIEVDQSIRSNFITEPVTSLIHMEQTIAGGASRRTLKIRDDILITETLEQLNTVVSITVLDHMFVDHSMVVHTQIVPITVIDNLIVEDSISTRTLSVQRLSNHIFVADKIGVRSSPNNQFVTQTIGVSQRLRSSPNYQAVQSDIAIASRTRQLDIDVFSRITVSQQINLNPSRLVIQKLPITQVVTANRVLNRSVISSINVDSKAYPGRIYVRNIVQHLIFPDSDYLLPVNFDPQPIVVPVVIGVILNAGIMTIRSQGKAIQLPPPQLGDGIEAVGTMEVRKSMDGTAFSYVQKTDRFKLTYRWKLSHLKTYELRAFVKESLSEMLTMVNWKGETWAVKITSNPFNFTNSGVWELDGEFAEVAMEFEGKKVGG